MILREGQSAQLLRAQPGAVQLDDVELTREGFRQCKLAVNLHHVNHGKECMAFLRKEGEHVGARTPDLILLDLNMPVMDGREVLAELVKDDSINHIAVVVLTTSADERDVVQMYKLKCSAYATKPVDFGHVVQGIGDFYFTVVVLPSIIDATTASD